LLFENAKVRRPTNCCDCGWFNEVRDGLQELHKRNAGSVAVSLMGLCIYGHIIANYSNAFALINKKGAKGPNGGH